MAYNGTDKAVTGLSVGVIMGTVLGVLGFLIYGSIELIMKLTTIGATLGLITGALFGARGMIKKKEY